jgi:hypothetical protein
MYQTFIPDPSHFRSPFFFPHNSTTAAPGPFATIHPSIPLQQQGIVAATPAQERPLILYAYHETAFARANLEYFINHGLHSAADFVFILNGETDAASTLIYADNSRKDDPEGLLDPEGVRRRRDNVWVVKRENTCFDLGSHSEVLNRVRGGSGWYDWKGPLGAPPPLNTTSNATTSETPGAVAYNATLPDSHLPLRKRYQKFILMNASIRGPFLPPYAINSPTPTCWSSSFLSRLTSHVKLVGMTYNCHYGQGHIQSMIWATDRTGLDILLERRGIGRCFVDMGQAMAAEIGSTQLVRDRGYEVEAFLSVYRSQDRKTKIQRLKARKERDEREARLAAAAAAATLPAPEGAEPTAKTSRRRRGLERTWKMPSWEEMTEQDRDIFRERLAAHGVEDAYEPNPSEEWLAAHGIRKTSPPKSDPKKRSVDDSSTGGLPPWQELTEAQKQAAKARMEQHGLEGVEHSEEWYMAEFRPKAKRGDLPPWEQMTEQERESVVAAELKAKMEKGLEGVTVSDSESQVEDPAPTPSSTQRPAAELLASLSSGAAQTSTLTPATSTSPSSPQLDLDVEPVTNSTFMTLTPAESVALQADINVTLFETISDLQKTRPGIPITQAEIDAIKADIRTIMAEAYRQRKIDEERKAIEDRIQKEKEAEERRKEAKLKAEKEAKFQKALLEDEMGDPGYWWRECREQDFLRPGGAYYGGFVHPFESIIFKSHRGIEDKTLENLTAWADGEGWSSFDMCF